MASNELELYTPVTDEDVAGIVNRREINRRSSDGITVIAYWLMQENIVVIEVDDARTGTTGEFIAPNDMVNERFAHALAYVAMQPYEQRFNDGA